MTVVLMTTSGCGSSDSQDQQQKEELTFNKDIAPLFFDHCAACHRPGASAPFSLLNYSQVSKRAEQIVDITARRIMPPWLPEHGYGRFKGERRLSDEQIAMIGRWVQQGRMRGDTADLPPLPQFKDGWQLGQPDLIVQMDRPYKLAAQGSDVFRNFVIDVPVTTTRYIKGVELRADNMQVIHHALIEIDRTGTSRRLDELDEQAGYAGMYDSGSDRPDGHLIGWVPGKTPFMTDDDMAWRLKPGSDLVLQLHMFPTGRPEQIRASIGLFFTDQQPTKVPALLRLGTHKIDIAAGRSDYPINDSYVLPVDVTVIGVYPHAHYLGKQMKGFATLADGSVTWLVYIKDWDFNWQDMFQFAEPIYLPRGTRLDMQSCTTTRRAIRATPPIHRSG